MELNEILDKLPIEVVALFEVLSNRIDTLENELKKVTQEKEDLQYKYDTLLESIKRLTKKQYGSSSENTNSLQLQLGLTFEETEIIDTNDEPKEETIQVTYNRKRGSNTNNIFDGLPVEVKDYIIEEQDRVLDDGTVLIDTGKVKISRMIELIPAQVYVNEQHQHIYMNLETEEEVLAPMPIPLFDNSPVTPSLASHIITQKYDLSLPLYRMEGNFKNMGVKLSRSVMSLWQLRVTFEFLQIIFDKIFAAFNEEEVAHADETPMQVIKEEGKTAKQKSYAWLLRTAEHSNRQIVLFFYSPRRSGKAIRKFLKNFKGYLHVDGFSAYETLSNMKLAGCWAHARRKFTDAGKGFAKDDFRMPLTAQGIQYINKLFKIERDIKHLSPEERYQERLKHSKPLLDEFFVWLENNYNKTAPKCKLGQAMFYCLNQKDKLLTFLEDGRLEIDNNLAERNIKSYVIGRKNWLFSFTKNGAKASAICYSIVETAKANGLIPYEYIKYILEELPNRTTTNIEDLMPWSQTLPDKCYKPIK